VTARRRDRGPGRPRILPDGDAARAEAVERLRAGGIVALPTDTVYGIAADLAFPDAIERLFAAKRRPPDKAVALLLADADQAAVLGIVGPAARVLAARFWPGGLTLVLPRRPDARLSAVLAAGASTVGVRVPDHPAPRALAAVLGPLPTTSANLSGEPDARDAAEIAARLGDAIELVLDGGPIRGGPASTVVDCTGPGPVIRRVGAIAPALIAAALDGAGIAHEIDHGTTAHPARDDAARDAGTRSEHDVGPSGDVGR
jgi:L-threonylcarbamoyladenylate synthase